MPLGPKIGLPRSHMLYIGSYKEIMKKSPKHGALTFCMQHYRVGIYQVLIQIVPFGQKMAWFRVHMLRVDLYRGTLEKNLLV